MDGSRYEIVAQGEHGKQGCHAYGITEIITENTAGKFRAGRRLDCNAAYFFTFIKIQPQEGKGQPGKIRSAAKRGDHDIRHVTSQLELFDFKPQLQKFNDQPIPQSYIEGKRFAFMDSFANLLQMVIRNSCSIC